MSRRPDPPRVAVVGGGGTGAALAWDLSLRGCSVILLERGELTSGTTGRHHGQLHCGARYAVGDRGIARECMEESLILKRLVPDAIEDNGGLFVAMDEEDAAWGDRLLPACREAGIPAREIPARLALELEPALNPAVLRALWVPDASFDAFRLPLSFLAGARLRGAEIRAWNEVVGVERAGGRVTALRVLDRRLPEGREERVAVDFAVSATGAWAGAFARLAGLRVELTPAPGAMLAVRGRLTDRVLSRLRPPGDGDILVPQRGLSIIGSTQRVTDDPDALLPDPAELAWLRGAGAELVPAFAAAPFRAAWCAARPLAGPAGADGGRSASRDFLLVDHGARDGLEGLASVFGGKATVLRAMAEKAADLVCGKLGLSAPCQTRELAPPSWRDFHRRAD